MRTHKTRSYFFWHFSSRDSYAKGNSFLKREWIKRAKIILALCFRDPRRLLSRVHDIFRRQTFEVWQRLLLLSHQSFQLLTCFLSARSTHYLEINIISNGWQYWSQNLTLRIKIEIFHQLVVSIKVTNIEYCHTVKTKGKSYHARNTKPK